MHVEGERVGRVKGAVHRQHCQAYSVVCAYVLVCLVVRASQIRYMLLCVVMVYRKKRGRARWDNLNLTIPSWIASPQLGSLAVTSLTQKVYSRQN